LHLECNPAINAVVSANFRQIIVVGGACVDVKAVASSPLVAATSNPGTVSITFGGVARNIAENLARLEVPVSLLTAIGADLLGQALRDRCRDLGIECRFLCLDGSSDFYSAVLSPEGEMVVAVAAMSCADRVDRTFIDSQQTFLSTASFLVCDTNLCIDALQAVGQIAQRAHIPLVIDPVSVRKAVRVRALLRAQIPIALLTPNRAELSVLAGRQTKCDADVARCCQLLQERRVTTLIVGLGERGAFVAAPGLEAFIEPAAEKLSDVTGAGDAALAAALWAVRAGYDWLAAGRAGQYAAGLTAATAATVSDALNPRYLLGRLAASANTEQMRMV
jgi:pseudouridine kinase